MNMQNYLPFFPVKRNVAVHFVSFLPLNLWDHVRLVNKISFFLMAILCKYTIFYFTNI